MKTKDAIEILKLIKDNTNIFGEVQLEKVFSLNSEVVNDIVSTMEDNAKYGK